MNTKVALCQLQPKAEKPEENLLKMEKVINECSEKGVELCVFPEDFLYGIIRGGKNVKTAGKQFPFWMKIFCSLAKKYKIDIIPGSFPLYENRKLFNTTVYIDSTGKVVNKYCKTNLWLSERNEYTPSLTPLKTFTSVLGKTAIIICWDMMNHRLFEEAVKQGAEWIINVSLWSTNQSKDLAKERGDPKRSGNGDSSLIDTLVRAKVYEYGLGVMFCNYGKSFMYKGRDGTNDISISAGHTQILSPLSKIRKITKSKNEEILICSVPSIGQYIKDQEVYYGRRKDVTNNYPYQI